MTGSIDENGVDKSGCEDDDSIDEAEVSSEASSAMKDKSYHIYGPPFPAELELRNGGQGGIWAKENLPQGVSYGPFTGIWKDRPDDPRYAWEVRAAGKKVFLDAALDAFNWMKFVRTSEDDKIQNIRVFFFTGKIFYKVMHDVGKGQELLLGPRHPLQFDSCGSGSESRYERESTSQHSSGTLDESRDEADEDENTCSFCEKTFTTLEQLDDHLISEHHYSPNQHRCDLCSRGFSWRPCLIRHQHLKHGDQKKYNCENCKKDFSDPSNLQRHIRLHHSGARSFACQECGKTFGTSSGLKQHTHIHSSIKPFRCEVCSKAYTQFSNLCRHKRNHIKCKTQNKCPKCNQAFNTGISLSKHRKFCDSSSSDIQSATSMDNNHRSHGALAWMPQAPVQPSPYYFFQRPFLPISSQFLPPCPSFSQNSSRYASSPLFPNSYLFDRNATGQMNSLDNSNDSTKPNGMNLESYEINSIKRKFHDVEKLHSINNFDKKLKESHSSALSFMFSSNKIPSSTEDLDKEVKESQNSAHLFMFSPNKISPSSAEEAVSNQKPSPARPVVSSSNSVSPREVQMKANVKSQKFKKEVDEDDSSDDREVELSDRKKNVKSLVENYHNCDQPLDLSIGAEKKKIKLEDESAPKIVKGNKVSDTSNNLVKKEEGSPSPSLKSDTACARFKITDEHTRELFNSKMLKTENDKHDEIGKTKLSDRASLSPNNDQSPQKSPDKNANLLPAMAYPKPMHRMVLESFYHPMSDLNLTPHYESFLSQDRFLSHPPSPFGPPRPYNLLESIVTGLNGQPVNRPAFDHLMTPPNNFGSSKPYQGILNQLPSNGPNSKLKDRYACRFCGKIFPRSANLTRHLRTHTGEQPYKCRYCERSFSISSNLQRHVRNIHNKERPFKCPLCARCFGQQTNLDRHLKKHEEDDESCVVAVADSPGSSNENEREDACFDEIRNFMGKVTYPGPNHYINPLQTNLYPPNVNVEDDEDDGEVDKDVFDVGSPQNSLTHESPLPLIHPIKSESPGSVNFKLQSDYQKDSILNNNNADQEAIQIST